MEIDISKELPKRIRQLHEIAPGSVGDLLKFTFTGYDNKTDSYCFICSTSEWMRNPAGTLHGGMCATILDQAMGFVAYCVKPGEGTVPTAEMQINYHRPLIPGNNVTICVYITSLSRSLISLRAEAFSCENEDKVCISGNALYFFKPSSSASFAKH